MAMAGVSHDLDNQENLSQINLDLASGTPWRTASERVNGMKRAGILGALVAAILTAIITFVGAGTNGSTQPGSGTLGPCTILSVGAGCSE
jgi:hypothetical protein